MSWELDGWDLDPGKPATRKLTGAHNLGWLPGLPGKGFIWSREGESPSVYTWNTAEGGAPNHHDVIERNFIPYREMKAPFDIDHQGRVRVPQSWEPTFNSSIGFNLDELPQVDPRLRFVPESEWDDAWDIDSQV
jgi:hypothetical protein